MEWRTEKQQCLPALLCNYLSPTENRTTVMNSG